MSPPDRRRAAALLLSVLAVGGCAAPGDDPSTGGTLGGAGSSPADERLPEQRPASERQIREQLFNQWKVERGS